MKTVFFFRMMLQSAFTHLSDSSQFGFLKQELIGIKIEFDSQRTGLVHQYGRGFYIGHLGKYHNTLCLSPQILHKRCFQFLLGLTTVPRENKNNAYAKFGGTNKEYYSIFRNGLF